jgi:hypothetical protein
VQIGTPSQYRWLETVIKTVLVLNLIDAVATLFWVRAGMAAEENPFMATLVYQHPITFVVLKMALVALGSALLWRYRHRPLAVVAVFLILIAYYAVLLTHVNFLARVALAHLSHQ